MALRAFSFEDFGALCGVRLLSENFGSFAFAHFVFRSYETELESSVCFSNLITSENKPHDLAHIKLFQIKLYSFSITELRDPIYIYILPPSPSPSPPRAWLIFKARPFSEERTPTGYDLLNLPWLCT